MTLVHSVPSLPSVSSFLFPHPTLTAPFSFHSLFKSEGSLTCGCSVTAIIRFCSSEKRCVSSALQMWKTLLLLNAGIWQLCSSLLCSSAPFNTSSLPCLEIPRCKDDSDAVSFVMNQLSTGKGQSQAFSEVSLCYDDLQLYVTHTAFHQTSLTPTDYNQCNDAIFNSNVMELFIAPSMEETPHCYNELDISPKNVMFDSGIYNPNLNYSGITGTIFPCATSGISHEVVVDEKNSLWRAEMTFPFSLLNCPFSCPLARYCGHSTPNNIYRANFFRISELTPTSKCSSTSCEYLAWNPTMRDPPAFHEPTKFGYLLLQDLE